jgi:hypothetical protein
MMTMMMIIIIIIIIISIDMHITVLYIHLSFIHHVLIISGKRKSCQMRKRKTRRDAAAVHIYTWNSLLHGPAQASFPRHWTSAGLPQHRTIKSEGPSVPPDGPPGHNSQRASRKSIPVCDGEGPRLYAEQDDGHQAVVSLEQRPQNPNHLFRQCNTDVQKSKEAQTEFNGN